MSAQKDPRYRIRRLIMNWAVPAGCGLLFLFLLKFVFFVGFVPTSSMEPAIMEGSFIFGFRVISELELGDIVVFENEDRLLVKRIAALPGDEVIIGGVVQTVPGNCYYMLGDNADASIDSRYWNEPFVEKSRIVARLPIY